MNVIQSVNLIVAVGKSNQIGLSGQIPWVNKKDLDRFKWITMGKPVIMGRKTFDSIPKPLLGRCEVVITSSPDRYSSTLTAKNLKEAMKIAYKETGSNEVFIIGGENLYKEAIYMTTIDYDGDADTYFPKMEGKWYLEYTENFNDKSNFSLWKKCWRYGGDNN
jgi:dihydrofolate reductase